MATTLGSFILGLIDSRDDHAVGDVVNEDPPLPPCSSTTSQRFYRAFSSRKVALLREDDRENEMLTHITHSHPARFESCA